MVRYYVGAGEFGGHVEEKDVIGEWVKYSDVEKLKEEISDLVENALELVSCREFDSLEWCIEQVKEKLSKI